MKRRLALKSEHLSDLTNDDLALVAGGTLTGMYPTINVPCHTVHDKCFNVAIRTLNSDCPTYGCLTGTTSV